RLPRLHDGLPRIDQPSPVVGMKGVGPSPPLCFVGGEAGIVEPAPIEEFGGPVCRRLPDQCRDRVQKNPNLAAERCIVRRWCAPRFAHVVTPRCRVAPAPKLLTPPLFARSPRLPGAECELIEPKSAARGKFPAENAA